MYYIAIIFTLVVSLFVLMGAKKYFNSYLDNFTTDYVAGFLAVSHYSAYHFIFHYLKNDSISQFTLIVCIFAFIGLGYGLVGGFVNTYPFGKKEKEVTNQFEEANDVKQFIS